MRWVAIGLAAALLSACAARTGTKSAGASASAPVEVQIIGFNDFHGALQPPQSNTKVPSAGASDIEVPAGGAAYFTSAIAALRATNPNTLVVSAGDMISASPLASSLFLDEPTIHTMNLAGVDLNAVGNHEFDRGWPELLRMQNGGCEKHTRHQPCRLEPFPGAKFKYLAANVVTEKGGTLFPGTAIRSFGTGPGQVRVGFIGMTLEGTANLVSKASTAGLSFRDEADTANAAAARLKAEGADAVVILIHEGLYTKVGPNDKSCGGVSGDMLGILERLDPAIDLVVSGHTHRAYVCDYGAIDPSRPILVTSAGNNGRFLTDIALRIDPAANKVVAKSADNLLVQRADAPGATSAFPSYPADPRVSSLVERYVAAAKALAGRPVGKLNAPARDDDNDDYMVESVLGDLIADAQLASARATVPSTQVAFMNPGGVRAHLLPHADGTVTFGDIYLVQPFGNQITIKRFTGRQLKALLEQQFDDAKAGGHSLLLPSATLRFGYDLSRPAGQRVIDPRLEGRPLADDATYVVAMSNFLAEGGDGFTAFRAGTDPELGETDLDALEAYIAAAGTLTPPAANRITNLTPP
jgi:5'-nucleotidase